MSRPAGSAATMDMGRRPGSIGEGRQARERDERPDGDCPWHGQRLAEATG